MTHDDGDWRGLKSDWQGSTPLEAFARVTLRGSLRWRIWASRAWFALEVLSFLFLGLAVMANLGAGQVVQGVGLGIVVAFCLAASVWARSGRVVGNLDSVPGMIDMTLSRARKSLRLVYGTYAVIAVSAVAVILDGQRVGERLVLLGFCGAITAAYQAYLRVRLARFESLQRYFRGTQQRTD